MPKLAPCCATCAAFRTIWRCRYATHCCVADGTTVPQAPEENDSAEIVIPPGETAEMVLARERAEWENHPYVKWTRTHRTEPFFTCPDHKWGTGEASYGDGHLILKGNDEVGEV